MAEAMRFGDRVLFLWEGEGGEGEGEKKKEEKGEKKKKRRHKTQITTKRLSIPIQLNSLLNTRKIKHRLPPPPPPPPPLLPSSPPTPLTPQPNTTSHRHFLHNNNPPLSSLPCPALPFPSRPLSIQSLATFQQFRTQSPNSKPHGSSDFNDRRDLKIGSSAKVCEIWGWGGGGGVAYERDWV